VDAADIEGCLNAQGRCQSRFSTELFILRAVSQPEIAVQETETICGPQVGLAGRQYATKLSRHPRMPGRVIRRERNNGV
jgi:hypothetical protein